MDDAHDPEPEKSPYVRLPWLLVAAGLVGVLAIALGLGLFANRYLRPQAEVAPTPIAIAAAPAATSVPVPTVAPTATNAPAPTALVQATVAAPNATSTPAPVEPTPGSVSTPTSAPATSPNASAIPTVDPALAHEVGKAYETFWRVRSQALLELDTTHLAEVMDEAIQNGHGEG